MRIWSESAPVLELDRGDRRMFVALGFLEVSAGAVHQVGEAVARHLERVFSSASFRHLTLSLCRREARLMGPRRGRPIVSPEGDFAA